MGTSPTSPNNLAQEIATKSQKKNSIWLPPECWVDVLKLLSRRQLLQCVQPACRRLHVIAECPAVPSIHIISHFDRFLDGLERNLPEANRRYKELAASEADLALHFRLGKSVRFEMEGNNRRRQLINMRRREVKMGVLRHSLELFRGCVLYMELDDLLWSMTTPLDPDESLAYLSLLAPTRPFSIELLHGIGLPGLHTDVLLRNPTVLACPRLLLSFTFPDIYPSAEAICFWLHHFPTADENNAENNDHQNSTTKTTRVLSFVDLMSFDDALLPNIGAELIERCKQSLQQANCLSDQRPFLLNLPYNRPNHLPRPFKLENSASGEVLQLGPNNVGDESMGYHLRKCPAAELANADKFCRDIFQDNNMDFRSPVMDIGGLDAPIVEFELNLRH